MYSTAECPQKSRSSSDPYDGQTGPLHGALYLGLSPLDRDALRVSSVGPQPSLPQGHLDDLCQMQGVAIGALGDLLPATEAVGDDQAVGRSLADCGQKLQF